MLGTSKLTAMAYPYAGQLHQNTAPHQYSGAEQCLCEDLLVRYAEVSRSNTATVLRYSAAALARLCPIPTMPSLPNCDNAPIR